MNRDFGLHFAAWFVLGTLIVLLSGFGFKQEGTWVGPGASGAAIFCYSFVIILLLATAGAIFDVLVFCPFVDWWRRRNRTDVT